MPLAAFQPNRAVGPKVSEPLFRRRHSAIMNLGGTISLRRQSLELACLVLEFPIDTE